MSQVVPKHIGFILDGNRRFAKFRGLKPWQGHNLGFVQLREIVDWCWEAGVEELTLYAFSMQNFHRSALEVKKLMQIIEKELTRLVTDPKIMDRDVRVRIIGETELLPLPVRKAIDVIESATASHKSFRLNFCIAYGGKEEILLAVKRLIAKVKDRVVDAAHITHEVFESYLLLQSEPDLIIRTGGDHRTSNFLPWQSTYSEWFFISKLLPEFERDDFNRILTEYGERERRFGK